jgi:hypothetical protein
LTCVYFNYQTSPSVAEERISVPHLLVIVPVIFVLSLQFFGFHSFLIPLQVWLTFRVKFMILNNNHMSERDRERENKVEVCLFCNLILEVTFYYCGCVLLIRRWARKSSPY